jgi:hypothetical protein
MLKVHDRVYAADEMIAEGLSGEVISLDPEAGDPELDTMYTVRMDDAVLEDGFWIEELELCKEGE